MSLAEFLKSKKSLNGFKEEKDPDIIGLDFNIIKQEHEDGMQLATPCGIAHMANNFAWMRGNQNCFTGFANSGKTQFTLFLMSVMSLVNKWKWVIWSPEMRRANFVDGKVKVHYNRLAYEIMATMSGKTPYRHIAEKFKVEYMTLDEKKLWYDWVKKYFIFLEPQERKIEDIYSTLLRVYENHGVDGMLIDPYKNIEQSGNERDDIHLHKSFARFLDLATKTNTVMNWIAHPKSGVNRIISVNGRQQLQVCNQYMLSGGAAWDNSMDGIYSVHRPNLLENSNDPWVEFHNIKERDQLLVAEKGYVENIKFDIKTRRYYFNDYDPLNGKYVQQPIEKFPTNGNAKEFDLETANKILDEEEGKSPF